MTREIKLVNGAISVVIVGWLIWDIAHYDGSQFQRQVHEIVSRVKNTHQDVAFAEMEMVGALLNAPGGLLANGPGGEAVTIWAYYPIIHDIIPNLDNTNTLPARPIDPQERQRRREAAHQAMLQALGSQESNLMYERGKARSQYDNLTAQANRLLAQIQNDESELSNENAQIARIPGWIEEQRRRIARQKGSVAGNQALSAAQVGAFRKIIREAIGYSGPTSILSDPSSPYAAPQLQDVVKPALGAIAAFESLGIRGPALDALIQTDESITVGNAAQKLQALSQTLTAQLELLQASHVATTAQLNSGLASLQDTLAELESSQTNLQNSIVALQQRISAGQGSVDALQRDLNAAINEIKRLDSAIANVEQEISTLQQQ